VTGDVNAAAGFAAGVLTTGDANVATGAFDALSKETTTLPSAALLTQTLPMVPVKT
jgi:hypothetical protein